MSDIPDAQPSDNASMPAASKPAASKKGGWLSGVRNLFEAGDERDLMPLEIRSRLLDEVVRTLEPFRGTEPLSFNRINVHVLMPIRQDKARYEAAIDDLDPPFDIVVRQRLKEAGFALPKVLAVDAVLHEEAPEDLRSAFEKYGTIYVEPLQAQPDTRASLVIERGRAEHEQYTIEGGRRVHIGRMRQVADDRGRVFRRNDVIFLDPSEADLSNEDAQLNGTISREHACIVFDPQQERFFWHNEQGNTSIQRAGYRRPMPVGRQPIPLEDGDELYLGQALVVFHLGDPEAAASS